MIQVALLAVAVVIIILIFNFVRKRHLQVSPPYIQALNYLLQGNDEHAIAALREAVKIDTDNIDAYIRLGDLLRAKGDFEKALRIHQSLTVRPKLSKIEERRIFKSLALDYVAAGRENRALALLKELVKNNRKDSDILKTLLSIFEEKNLYQDALDFLKGDGKKIVDKRIQAIYYVKYAQMISDDDPKAAKNYFNQALKLAPNSPFVLYAIADMHLNENNIDATIERLQELLMEQPDFLAYVKDKIENAYFEGQRFQEIEDFYEKLLRKHPYNIPVSLALVRLYQKKGEDDKLVSLIDKLKEYQPGLMLPKLVEISVELKPGPAAEQLNSLIEVGEKHLYRCAVCKFEKDTFEWRCPNCGSWESFRLLFLS